LNEQRTDDSKTGRSKHHQLDLENDECQDAGINKEWWIEVHQGYENFSRVPALQGPVRV
jgi:uncharacterized protein YqkB